MCYTYPQYDYIKPIEIFLLIARKRIKSTDIRITIGSWKLCAQLTMPPFERKKWRETFRREKKKKHAQSARNSAALEENIRINSSSESTHTHTHTHRLTLHASWDAVNLIKYHKTRLLFFSGTIFVEIVIFDSGVFFWSCKMAHTHTCDCWFGPNVFYALTKIGENTNNNNKIVLYIWSGSLRITESNNDSIFLRIKTRTPAKRLYAKMWREQSIFYLAIRWRAISYFIIELFFSSILTFIVDLPIDFPALWVCVCVGL